MLLCPRTDQNNESLYDTTDNPNPLVTPKEKYLQGLLKEKEYSWANVIVKEVKGGALHLWQRISGVEISFMTMEV